MHNTRMLLARTVVIVASHVGLVVVPSCVAPTHLLPSMPIRRLVSWKEQISHLTFLVHVGEFCMRGKN